MNGQQANIDAISNNLSNVNTTGYKQQRVEFEDLMYQNIKKAGTPATDAQRTPSRTELSHRGTVGSSDRRGTPGAVQRTGVDTDLAVVGEGYFRVQQYDGSFAYTRDGSFKVDMNGQLVTSEGLRVMPEIILPEGFNLSTLAISDDGRVTVKVDGNDDPILVGL